MIACEQQLLLALIPETKGKDTIQMLRAVLTPFKIGVQQHLCIGLRSEGMTTSLQFFIKFSKVVQLAIVIDHIGLFMHLVNHGLSSAKRVNYLQAVMR